MCIRDSLSVSRERLGDLAAAAGDLAGAGEHYRAGLAIAERLAAADPTNTEWQRDLSISRERLGDLAVAAGDPTGAAEHYQAGLAIVRRLTEAHLDVFLPELARSLTSLGVVLTELDDTTSPRRWIAKRNMVIDLMNFGRTEGEAARELEQLIRASHAHSD